MGVTKLEKRKTNNIGPDMVVSKLPKTISAVAQYFSEKENKSMYKVAIDMIPFQPFENNNTIIVHPVLYEDGDMDYIARGLRTLIHGFIALDIHKNIVLERVGYRLINIFDDEIIPDPNNPFVNLSKIKELNLYTGWKGVWINSILARAAKINDYNVFDKILHKVDANKHKTELMKIINSKTFPVGYKVYVMRYLSESLTDDLEL